MVDSKLPGVGTTIFTVMSQLAADCNAINLSQGFPSFEPDPELLDLVEKHLRGGANQYAPMPGVPALREAIASKVHQFYGFAACPDRNVTVTSGATEALFSAIAALVRIGDEVIVFDPAYDSYEPAVTLAGGITRHIPLIHDGDGQFSIDWQTLAETLNQKTRLLIVNFPHNPTGTILRRTDLDRLADVVRNTDTYILADEVYEHIVFDGKQHNSLLCHPELRARAVVVSSFGKTYHATGWKVGYAIAEHEITAEFRKVHQFNQFAVVTPIQHAIAEFMAVKPNYYQILIDTYSKQRDYFAQLLADSGFRLQPTKSTFFQLLDYADISSEDDDTFAERLTREIGVASIPISVFYAEQPPKSMLRFCFAKDDATLKEAAKRLCSI